MKRYVFEVCRWGTDERLDLVFTETTSKRKARAACSERVHIGESLGRLVCEVELK